MKFFKEYIITAIVGLLLAVVLIVSAKMKEIPLRMRSREVTMTTGQFR